MQGIFIGFDLTRMSDQKLAAMLDNRRGNLRVLRERHPTRTFADLTTLVNALEAEARNRKNRT